MYEFSDRTPPACMGSIKSAAVAPFDFELGILTIE
jgi:hypothetical protein